MKIDRVTLARSLIAIGIAPYLLIGVPNALGMLIFAKQTQNTILNYAVYWFMGILALMLLLSLLFSSESSRPESNQPLQKAFKTSSRKLVIWGMALVGAAALILAGGAFATDSTGFLVERILSWIVALLTFGGILLLAQSIYQAAQKSNNDDGQ